MTQLLSWLRSIGSDKRKASNRIKAKQKSANTVQWEMSAKDALLVKTLKSKS